METLAKSDSARDKKTIVALMCDEISIHKQVEWTGTEYFGYVDIGGGYSEGRRSELAGNALVFMAVSVLTR